MTDEEFIAAQAKLAEIDTECAALDRVERDCIERAREFNDARRTATGKRTSLLKGASDLRQAVAEHAMQVKRQQAAKAAEEAAAKAAEPQPPNALEVLAAEVKSLREQLAAKG